MPPRLTAPILFVHGLGGFTQLPRRNAPKREYFPGIRAYLEAAGNHILMPRVSPTAGIATRAAELKGYLARKIGTQPVHIIGHSLGGLDARYMISRLGMESQVLSLTTIGTPHRGSPFADWAVARLARLFRPLFRLIGLPDEGIFDLTTDACRRFNEDTPDVPGVRYYSVAGHCESPWLPTPWYLPSRIVARAEGINDGVVSVRSAIWGEHTDYWFGDHLNLVNWPNRRLRRAGEWHDRAAEYGQLLARLEPDTHQM